MKKKESEFGAGLTYCIGLFLAHTERSGREVYKKIGAPPSWAEMWFNGASDHCYELDTSTIKNKKLREDIEKWREKVLHWGHGFSEPWAAEKDLDWALGKAKEFLRIIDEKLLKIKTIKGQWE